ncbi:MAG: thiamine pyrophosphate-binding protein [Thermoplasmatales archaeon]
MKGFRLFGESIRNLNLLPMFGNPGTTEIGALRDVDNYVLTLFDGLAVGMADGMVQISGIPRIVNLHTALGLGNSMGYIFTAKSNRTPLVITAGQQDMRHIHYEPLLSGDLIELVGRNAKFSYEVKNAGEIPDILKRAKREALTPPMGPVFVSLPMNVMDEDVSSSPADDVDVIQDQGSEEIVNKVADIINESKNPAIVMGWEIDLFNAFNEAQSFAEKLGCAVYGEPLPQRSPFLSESKYYAGDLLPATTLINLKLVQNDLVLFIGGDVTLYPYLPSPLLEGKKIVFVGQNITPKIGEFYRMNVKNFLKEITPKLNKKCDFVKQENFQQVSKAARERQTMGTTYVMNKVRKILHDYVVVDEAISASTVLREVLGYSPSRYFSAKSGQLGWASPAAAGMSMVNDKVLAVVGDGSFMYSIQILWTVKRYALPLKFLILRNGGYGILKSFSTSYYPGMENKDYMSFTLNIEDIAESFGIESRVAGRDLEELRWLSEGKESKLLVVDVDKSIPKLFL